MNRKNLLTFGLSIVAGIAVWPIFLIGLGVEPWDTPYGTLVVLGLGLLFGLCAPRKPWLWPIGIYLGQFLFGTASFLKSLFFYREGGVNFFFPIGMIALIYTSAPAFITSFLGSGIRMVARKRREKRHGT